MHVYIIKQGNRIELFKTLSLLCSCKNICRKTLYDKGIKEINKDITYKGYIITKKEIINIYK